MASGQDLWHSTSISECQWKIHNYNYHKIQKAISFVAKFADQGFHADWRIEHVIHVNILVGAEGMLCSWVLLSFG